MIAIIALFASALMLSAFFSGTETGFYRATRLRLVVDALGGDWIAHSLLWLTNHPSLFVATALVGNNIANYLTSLAIVIGASRLTSGSQVAEIAAPLLLAPFVFVCAELLPKNLFLEAPNRLLRQSGPALIFCTLLLLPLTVVLWGLGRLLELVVRRSSQQLRAALARRQVAEALAEGHQAGILRPTQQTIAQSTLALASRPVREFVIPAGRYPPVSTKMDKQEVLRVARRQRRPLLPVEDPSAKRKLLGYVRVVDLALDESDRWPRILPMIEIDESTTYLAALLRLQKADDAMGHVVSKSGQPLGYVTIGKLRDALFDRDHLL